MDLVAKKIYIQFKKFGLEILIVSCEFKNAFNYKNQIAKSIVQIRYKSSTCKKKSSTCELKASIFDNV